MFIYILESAYYLFLFAFHLLEDLPRDTTYLHHSASQQSIQIFVLTTNHWLYHAMSECLWYTDSTPGNKINMERLHIDRDLSSVEYMYVLPLVQGIIILMTSFLLQIGRAHV